MSRELVVNSRNEDRSHGTSEYVPAGIDGVGVHTLRHSAAVAWRSPAYTSKAVAER
jgi:hypothetical protein